MGKNMRTYVDRIVLFLLGIICPVFIAACYAAPSNYSRTGKVIGGRVVDSQQKTGIPGIQISCHRNSNIQPVLTNSNGYFQIDGECYSLQVTDIDVEENGGFYLPRRVPTSEDCENMTIELHH